MSTKGSTTIEVAIVLPIIMYILFIMIHITIIVYQRGYIKSMCNNILSSASLRFDEPSINLYSGIYEVEKVNVIDIYTDLYDKNEKSKIKNIENNLKEKIIKNTIVKPKEIDIVIELKHYIAFKVINTNIRLEYQSPLANVMQLFGINANYQINIKSKNRIRRNRVYINDIDFAFEIYDSVKDKSKFLEDMHNAIDKLKKRLVCE